MARRHDRVTSQWHLAGTLLAKTPHVADIRQQCCVSLTCRRHCQLSSSSCYSLTLVILVASYPSTTSRCRFFNFSLLYTCHCYLVVLSSLYYSRILIVIVVESSPVIVDMPSLSLVGSADCRSTHHTHL